MTATSDSEERRTRPFADLLRELDKGRVHNELSTKLQELVEAVISLRKPGTVTLALRIDAGKSDDMVELTAAVTSKVPKQNRTSVFFVDDEHNLSRNNPHQPYLPLSGVPGDGSDQPATDSSRSAR